MISYDMYKLIRSIPLYPGAISPDKVFKKARLKKERFDFLIQKAIDDDYIFYFGRNHPNTPLLYLTETGVLAVEEYRSKHTAAKKSTIALIISGLSLLASIVAIVISYVV